MGSAESTAHLALVYTPDAPRAPTAAASSVDLSQLLRCCGSVELFKPGLNRSDIASFFLDGVLRPEVVGRGGGLEGGQIAAQGIEHAGEVAAIPHFRPHRRVLEGLCDGDLRVRLRDWHALADTSGSDTSGGLDTSNAGVWLGPRASVDDATFVSRIWVSREHLVQAVVARLGELSGMRAKAGAPSFPCKRQVFEFKNSGGPFVAPVVQRFAQLDGPLGETSVSIERVDIPVGFWRWRIRGVNRRTRDSLEHGCGRCCKSGVGRSAVRCPASCDRNSQQKD